MKTYYKDDYVCLVPPREFDGPIYRGYFSDYGNTPLKVIETFTQYDRTWVLTENPKYNNRGHKSLQIAIECVRPYKPYIADIEELI